MRRPLPEVDAGSILRILRCPNCRTRFEIEWTDVTPDVPAETIDKNTAIRAAQFGWTRRRPKYRWWGPERWFCENHR